MLEYYLTLNTNAGLIDNTTYNVSVVNSNY